MNRNQRLLAHAKPIEVEILATSILTHCERDIPNVEPVFMENLKELELQNNLLRSSAGFVRKGAYTHDKIKVNKEIARLFVGLKYLVKAYLYHPDKELQRAANKVWSKIVRLGVDLHKLSLEKKITRIKILEQEMVSGKLKGEFDRLPDAKTYVISLKSAMEKLNNLYQLRIDEVRERANRVQATRQAQKVHRFLNDEILPFLFTMQKIAPDVYSNVAKIAQMDLEKLNKKIRARRTLWAKRKENRKDKME